jgi:hypothetical protein
MQLSAEIRLFWFGEKPAALEAWFLDDRLHSLPLGIAEDRTDIYLADPSQIELGVKTRGSNSGIEVKGLIATLDDPLEFDSYRIPVELWSKWPSQSLGFDIQSGVTLRKQRWLRKFDTAGAKPVDAPAVRPDIGCNVEWTVVTLPSGESSWTLGFEAFGHLANVETSLRSVVRLMCGRNPPPAPGAKALSYPEWLRSL